jgi:hypothetical protein
MALRFAEAHMSLKQYLVSYENGEWKVIFEDEHIGGYPSKAAAVRAAVDAAHLEGSRGSETEVLLMTKTCTFPNKWRYGRDQYPPA